VFIDDTMIRKGVLFLCIFGSPYAFGKLESLDSKLFDVAVPLGHQIADEEQKL